VRDRGASFLDHRLPLDYRPPRNGKVRYAGANESKGDPVMDQNAPIRK
jgi:hypothetical protein